MARYIDADNAIKEIRGLAEKHHSNGEYEFANGVLKAITRITSQPIAEVKEVVFGKWKIEKKSKFNYDKCSICGFNKPSFLEFRKYDFCPHCGANMREGVE